MNDEINKEMIYIYIYICVEGIEANANTESTRPR